MHWWPVLLSVALGLLLLWLVLVVALWASKPDDVTLKQIMRLLPDLILLLRRLAADPELPRGVRIRLLLLLGYLLLPFDLVPDFIPVLGYADDAVVVALALRSVVKRAGPEAVQQHWPGTADGLHTLRRVLRV